MRRCSRGRIPGRKRLIVGVVKNGEGARFSYLTGDDLDEARRRGFAGYPAFTSFDTEYQSGVIESVSSRLPIPKRSDYDAYLSHWFIDPAARPTPLEVLAYTGGTLPRDGFGFLPVLPDEGPFDFVTELAGTRDREPSAQVGEEVEFVLEPTNPKDPQAVVATVVRGGSPSCVSG